MGCVGLEGSHSAGHGSLTACKASLALPGELTGVFDPRGVRFNDLILSSPFPNGLEARVIPQVRHMARHLRVQALPRVNLVDDIE